MDKRISVEVVISENEYSKISSIARTDGWTIQGLLGPMLREQVKEVLKEKESKSYAEHVKKQMATLKDYDHELFEDIVDGLKCKGWVEEGGSPVFRLLHKDEFGTIKVFRNEEAPAVIKICFSAEPEEVTDEEVA